ncbi:NAD(P)/FAD-dependent oxidoreductase [Niveispirillum sp. KHB5.9]|uniref:NAD(P)/FAD-dependent oxidoreductase n=1 Tax=Niveispirillum sp. KHB5.9 TaxID=3400269 RepID=UPI003A8C70A5
MQEFDIAIIGAGIGGASLAAMLAGGVPGRRILLAERESFPGYHTTGRSAALYSVLYGNSTVCTLTAASRAFFMDPPPGFADHPLLTPRGVLYITDDPQSDAVREIRESAIRTGATALEMSPRAALDMVPILHPGPLRGALWEADAMDMDVHAIHQGFLRRAKAGGVELRTDAALTGAGWDGSAWTLSFADGPVRAKKLVNAAGAWADELARMAGVPTVGLMPLRRTAMMLDPPPGFDIHRWPAVIDAGGSFYFKPDAGMILASPADETPSPPCDAQADEMDIAICVDRVQASADLPVRRVSRSWAGLRSFVADRSPVVGAPASHPSFFWFAAQGGYGIQMAPALARVGASLLDHGVLPADIADAGVSVADLSPDRCKGE